MLDLPYLGCPNIHKLYLHGHVDGEEHSDGVGLSKDKGILQGKTWIGISGIFQILPLILLSSFEVVDMRWGVRDEMTNEHATTALCMNELKGCQKYSMGPNFIYFGAQKYGYRPIPSEIVTDELNKLIDVLQTMGNDVTLLKKWYRKDNNKVS